MTDTLPPCPTPCEADCGAQCHEAHAVASKRGHQPHGCHEIRVAIAGWVMAERTRITAVARELGATYPVTIPAASGELGARHAAFPFADYLEDVAPPPAPPPVEPFTEPMFDLTPEGTPK